LEHYSKFVAKIKGVEAEINARNKNPSLKLRSALPYELLAPTSGPGLTNRGVPQSISI
jgi:lipoxygenase